MVHGLKLALKIFRRPLHGTGVVSLIPGKNGKGEW